MYMLNSASWVVDYNESSPLEKSVSGLLYPWEIEAVVEDLLVDGGKVTETQKERL